MRCACLLALLVLPATAAADPFHGNVALLGGRASALGGAATGLPEDDSAPFYNPAAISADPYVQVSFSAEALQLQQRSFTPYLGSRATESWAGLVPNASVGSSAWRGGRASFAVFTTEDENLTLDHTFTPFGDTGVAFARIRRLETTQTYQAGPSYGHPVNEFVTVGISALYVYRTQAIRADEYAEASDPAASPAAITHTEDTEGVSQGLAFVGGLRVQPTGPQGPLTLGLALRSGVSLAEQIVRREERFNGLRQPDGSVLFTREPTHESTESQAGQPAAAMLGASWRFSAALLCAQLTVTSAEPNLAPGVNGRLTVDGALGGEWQVDRAHGWTARAGLYTRRSSVSDAALAPKIDQYGAALGVGKLDAHHVTDAALVLQRESGQAPVASVSGGTAAASVSGYTLLITLGGAFRF